MGIRIPEEISLVGFDNLPFARACNPKLDHCFSAHRENRRGYGRDYAGTSGTCRK
ncbi:MAG: hypothetical protein ACLU4P_00560 [Ruminococcus sp.]